MNWKIFLTFQIIPELFQNLSRICSNEMNTKIYLLVLALHLFSVSAIAQIRTDTSRAFIKPFRSLIDMKDMERFEYPKLVIPIILVGSGISMNGNHFESIKHEIVEERNEIMPSFRTYMDDYLQFSPLVATFGLDALGIPSKTDILDRSVILLRGEATMFAATQLIKRTSRQLRPDGSNLHSFPSGHTAQAFLAATFLSEEYGYRYPWMPYAAFGVASSVGAFRMLNNKHYISDVLVGAGIGILSMKMSYWTHRYFSKKSKSKS